MNEQLQAAVETLRPFINPRQLKAMCSYCYGEEKQFFLNKFSELARIVSTMPKTYETDGQGDKAVAHLHYFAGGSDFYITEKDKGDGRDEVPGQQHQAFGLSDVFGDGGELGYVSIAELIQHKVELDLYWTPRTLAEIRKERNRHD